MVRNTPRPIENMFSQMRPAPDETMIFPFFGAQDLTLELAALLCEGPGYDRQCLLEDSNGPMFCAPAQALDIVA